MGATWAGKNEWSLRSLGSSARKAARIRRRAVADRAVMRLPSRRRPVQSEFPLSHVRVLTRDEIAAGSASREAAPGHSGDVLLPAALTFGRGAASAPPVGCAPARAPRPMHATNERTGGR